MQSYLYSVYYCYLYASYVPNHLNSLAEDAVEVEEVEVEEVEVAEDVVLVEEVAEDVVLVEEEADGEVADVVGEEEDGEITGTGEAVITHSPIMNIPITTNAFPVSIARKI